MPNSNNHGGRREGAGRPSNAQSRRSIAAAAREYGEDALKTLAEIMRDDEAPPAARIAASTALLDRGHGKPAQFSTDDPGAFRKAMDMTDDELAAIAAASSEGTAEAPEHPPVLN
jgi:hypothetical protein